jgi:bacillithiol biosynthesis deacetylase BshB1
MKLDLLVIAAHPDDAELGCGGTIAKHLAAGKKVGVLDLTRGELGTRGTAEIRETEASEAAKVLGLTVRDNVGLADGFFQNSKSDQLKLVAAIRKYQPEIVLANAVYDRHPDHGRASDLIYDSCFLAGLPKVETTLDGKQQSAWRPKAIYHFIQSRSVTPDIVVDVTDFWEIKMKSVLAYKSQFHDPNSKEPATFISSPQFLKMVEARAIEYGQIIGVQYGEGYTVRKAVGIKNLFDIF